MRMMYYSVMTQVNSDVSLVTFTMHYLKMTQQLLYRTTLIHTERNKFKKLSIRLWSQKLWDMHAPEISPVVVDAASECMVGVASYRLLLQAGKLEVCLFGQRLLPKEQHQQNIS